MDSKIQKQEQHMLMYWEQSVGGLHVEDFDTKVEDENYVTQKLDMWCNDEEEQMKDLEVNTILILQLQMTKKSLSNNYKNEGSRIQKFEVNLLGVLVELTKVFAQSSNVFAQSSYLLAQSIEVSI